MGLQTDYGIIIRHDGSDISDHILSYNWNKKVCTGVGTLTVEVDNSIFVNIDISDVITVHENSSLVFTGYVQRISNDYNNGVTLIECQDKSKFLIDYFISESYLIDYISYTRTWIEQFLGEAQISYTFLTDEIGQIMSNNTSLGMMSAYDQIMTLLQQTGWYIEFNASGTAIIGKLTSQMSGSVSIDKSRIIGIEILRDDKMFRNRGVVWGNSNPLNGIQVYADVYRPTAWDIDSYDKRAFVIANSNIPNAYSAQVLANIGLDEFAKITEEKHITVESLLDVSFASRVYVTSDVFNGSGIVTTYGTSLNSGGLTTNIILDERCPRLFGSFYDFGDYVYVGTDGAGVKRKSIGGSTWSDFSTGISDLHISDLYKKKDLLVCVTVSGEAYRAYGGSSSWTQLNIPSLESDLGVISSGLMARACILDKTNSNIRLLVDNTEHGNDLYDYDIHAEYILTATSGAGSRAWVLDYTANGYFLESYQISTSGSDFTYAGADIDNDGANDFISVTTASIDIGEYPTYDFGYNTSYYEDNSITLLSDTEEYSDKYGTHTPWSTDVVIFENSISTYSTDTLEETNYAIVDASTSETVLYIYRKTGTSTFSIRHYHTGYTSLTVLGSINLDGDTTRFIGYEAGSFYTFDFTFSTTSAVVTEIATDFNLDTTKVIRHNGYVYFSVTTSTGDYAFSIVVYAINMSAGTMSEYMSFNSGGDTTHQARLIGIYSPYLYISGGIVRICAPYTYVVKGPIDGNDCTVYLKEVGTGTSFGPYSSDSWIDFGSPTTWWGDIYASVQLNRTYFYISGYISKIDAGTIKFKLNNNGFVLDETVKTSQVITNFINDDSIAIYSILGNFTYTDGDISDLGEVVIDDVDYTLLNHSGTVDSLTGELIVVASKTGDSASDARVLKISSSGAIKTNILIKNALTTSATPIIHGRWVVLLGFYSLRSTMSTYYISSSGIEFITINSKILKRTNSDFEIIKEGQGGPSRLDLSDSNPLMRHASRNLYSLKLYDTGQESWIDMSAGSSQDDCFDARYCHRQETLESNSKMSILYTTTTSGVGFGGAKLIDLDPYYSQEEGNTEDFSQLLGDGTEFIAMSGARWVETTNYKYPYQYIFVASSGLPCKFYQQDYDDLAVLDYSAGLPASSPITIIRMDDSI